MFSKYGLSRYLNKCKLFFIIQSALNNTIQPVLKGELTVCFLITYSNDFLHN